MFAWSLTGVFDGTQQTRAHAGGGSTCDAGKCTAASLHWMRSGCATRPARPSHLSLRQQREVGARAAVAEAAAGGDAHPWQPQLLAEAHDLGVRHVPNGLRADGSDAMAQCMKIFEGAVSLRAAQSAASCWDTARITCTLPWPPRALTWSAPCFLQTLLVHTRTSVSAASCDRGKERARVCNSARRGVRASGSARGCAASPRPPAALALCGSCSPRARQRPPAGGGDAAAAAAPQPLLTRRCAAPRLSPPRAPLRPTAPHRPLAAAECRQAACCRDRGGRGAAAVERFRQGVSWGPVQG